MPFQFKRNPSVKKELWGGILDRQISYSESWETSEFDSSREIHAKTKEAPKKT
jgi:hypothetical protein